MATIPLRPLGRTTSIAELGGQVAAARLQLDAPSIAMIDRVARP